MFEDEKQHEKTLEMRVAELEDKLAQIHITEEEMRAYHKVNNLLRGQPAGPVEPHSPQIGAVPQYAPSGFYVPYPYIAGPRHCGYVDIPGPRHCGYLEYGSGVPLSFRGLGY